MGTRVCRLSCWYQRAWVREMVGGSEAGERRCRGEQRREVPHAQAEPWSWDRVRLPGLCGAPQQTGFSGASGRLRECLSRGGFGLLPYLWKTQEKENGWGLAGNEGRCRRSV